jgi:hypothetical protein
VDVQAGIEPGPFPVPLKGCSFYRFLSEKTYVLVIQVTKMPTVAILETRRLHYKSKQGIDEVSKKLFGIWKMAIPKVVALNLWSVGIEPMT